MNQNKIQEESYQTLAPDEPLDKTLYRVLQFDKEDAIFLSAIHDDNYKNLIFSLLYK